MQEQQQQKQQHHAVPASAMAGAQQHATQQQQQQQMLFTTPADLLCPITQELLHDPVLATSGQIYERAAIETHLARAAAAGAPLTDPVSNAPLASDALLPVYPMRSRAAEYRASTARACAAAAAAASASRADAARLLRRAAELALPPAGAASAAATAAASTATAGLLVAAPGLSPELARFVTSHPGDAYAALALKWFAQELSRQGYRDRAADVLYALLLEECDRAQQAEYLQLTLETWGHKAAESAGGGGGDGGAGSGKDAGGGSGGVTADAAVIAKLADFVDRQTLLAPGDIVDMLQVPSGIGRGGALRLCEALLSRLAGGGGGSGGGKGAGDGGGGKGGGDGGAAATQARLSRAVELLVRYVRLSCASDAPAGAPGARAGGAATGAAAAAVSPAAVAPASSSAGGKPRRGKRLRAAAARAGSALGAPKARAAAACALAAASLANGSGIVLRVARLVPLLVLLHSPQQGEGKPSAKQAD